MGYSLGYFSDFGSFFKMAITRKIEVGISSNLLCSIFTSICMRKCNNFFCDFGAIFMGYSLGYFSDFGSF